MTGLKDRLLAIAARLRAAARARPASGAKVGAGDGQTHIVDGRAGEVAWAGLQAQALTAAGEIEDAMAGVGLLPADETPWRSARTPPEPRPHGPDHAVIVIGVVDDPRYRINGDEPFADYVAWWPAKGIWTVTHCTRADGPEGQGTADDYPVRVRCWQPGPELPPPWSTVWA